MLKFCPKICDSEQYFRGNRLSCPSCSSNIGPVGPEMTVEHSKDRVARARSEQRENPDIVVPRFDTVILNLLKTSTRKSLS